MREHPCPGVGSPTSQVLSLIVLHQLRIRLQITGTMLAFNDGLGTSCAVKPVPLLRNVKALTTYTGIPSFVVSAVALTDPQPLRPSHTSVLSPLGTQEMRSSSPGK